MRTTDNPLSGEQMELLLRDEADRVEVPVERLIEQAVRRGTAARRRRRRLALAGSCAGAVAVAVVVALVPLGTVQDSPPLAREPSESANPAPPPVPASALPDHIEQSTRATLEPRVDLGKAEIRALDANLRRLPDTTHPSLAGVLARFGTAEHAWQVFLGREVDPPTTDGCPAQSANVRCDFERYADGTALTTTVTTMMRMPGTSRFIVGDLPPLDSIALADLRFERQVRALRPDGSVTSVTEQVTSPTTRVPEDAFGSSAGDLASLALLPTLRLPPKR